jgi:hypothetical protein
VRAIIADSILESVLASSRPLIDLIPVETIDLTKLNFKVSLASSGDEVKSEIYVLIQIFNMTGGSLQSENRAKYSGILLTMGVAKRQNSTELTSGSEPVALIRANHR